MNYALFDVLNGRFQNGSAVGRSNANALLLSIQDHLRRLLNARQGVLRHLPDYGLPDVPALYDKLPYTKNDLALAVRETVQRFEPRLSDVEVRLVPVRKRHCVLGIEVTGQLPGGERVRFRSRFRTGGSAEVSGALGEEVDDDA